jgi:hypothetical protein
MADRRIVKKERNRDSVTIIERKDILYKLSEIRISMQVIIYGYINVYDMLIVMVLKFPYMKSVQFCNRAYDEIRSRGVAVRRNRRVQ